MGKVVQFLFGKGPDIFDKKGRVRHNLPQEKWDSWNRRYMAGAEFNWHNHRGMKAEPSSSGKKNDKRPQE